MTPESSGRRGAVKANAAAEPARITLEERLLGILRAGSGGPAGTSDTDGDQR